VIQKSKIKKLINSKGLSVSAQSYDSIERVVSEVVEQLCANTVEDNMKTVMPHHCVLKQKTVTEKAPKDGVNLKPQFYRWARTVQDFCHEQAVILSKEV
jgi:UDP-glucose 6-dehydrogenase